MNSEDRELTPETIRLTIEHIKSVSRLASLVSVDTIDALLSQLSLEETLMPLLDPTAYLRTADKTRWHGPYLRAFRAYRKALAEIAKEEGLTP